MLESRPEDSLPAMQEGFPAVTWQDLAVCRAEPKVADVWAADNSPAFDVSSFAKTEQEEGREKKRERQKERKTEKERGGEEIRKFGTNY